MLDLYQIKNGKFKKNESVQDVAKEIKVIIEMMQIPCQQKNLRLILIIDPNLPQELIIDMQRVR